MPSSSLSLQMHSHRPLPINGYVILLDTRTEALLSLLLWRPFTLLPDDRMSESNAHLFSGQCTNQSIM